ncbi:MAG: hypothetical protein JOZ78_10450 [Chroococcidiopsidaceae cyanobacterium CP_BM_ER_R8_30]|nr:hypothetical protein [Chroococcidiopsidaceae cyanobacterium CP_BM_ER_R8_30]
MVTKSPQKQPERKEHNNNFQQSRQEVPGAIQSLLESINHPKIHIINNSIILQKKIAKYSKSTEKLAKDAISTKSINDDFSSKKRVNYTQTSASQPQFIFKRIGKVTNRLFAISAVFLGVCIAYHYCYSKEQINPSEKGNLVTIQLLKKGGNHEECVKKAKAAQPKLPCYTLRLKIF